MEEELKAYGLSEKETKIYLACLKLGSITANKISFETGIRRSTVYEVLESLRKKGLVKSVKKEKKNYFESVKPNILIDLLKEKEQRIKKILPQLNEIAELNVEKPEIVLYEGKIGIKNAIGEMLESKEILVYGASQEGDKLFDSFPENFARKRVERKIMLRAIIENISPKYMLEKEVKKFTEIRTLKCFDKHKVAYFIYNNYLLIITLGEELVAVKIESPLLAESQRILFEALWKVAKH